MHKTIEYFGAGTNDYYVNVQEYDITDRVIEERSEDASGCVLTKATYDYDARGNRTSTTQYHLDYPVTATTRYNTYNEPECLTDADGHVSHIRYDYHHVNDLGQFVLAVETTDPLGNSTFIENDALKRMRFQIRKNALGEVIQKREFFYDGEGNCIKQVEHVITPGQPDRQVASLFVYDFLNRLVKLTEAASTPEQKQTHYVYNHFRQKAAVIKPDGVELRHAYDWLGRLIEFKATDGSFHYQYEYDANSNVIRVDDVMQGHATIRVYDELNRLVSETLPAGLTTQATYDRVGRTTKLVLPDGSCVGYSYENQFLKEIRRNDYVHTYERYNLSGSIESCQLIGAAGSLKYTLDAFQRVIGIDSKHWKEEVPQNGYDAVGNLLQKEITDCVGTVSSLFAYDDLYQLKSEKGIQDHIYTHDSLYNIVEKDEHPQEINSLNQLLNNGKERWEYDLNGNLLVKGNQKFEYDALDRLISVENGNEKFVYTYDELNRRLSSFDQKTEKTTYYLYQGQNEIGACNAQGFMHQFRVLGAGKGAEIGASVLLELEGVTYAPVHDSSGHIRMLIHADSGSVYETYRYSAFGEEQLYNAKFEKVHVSKNPWRYSSKRCDDKTGFVYFGRRYYDPENARWVTADPMGFEAGPNLYAYVFNSPLIHFDLYGLERESNENWSTRERFYEFVNGTKETRFSGRSGTETSERESSRSSLPQVRFNLNFEKRFIHYDKSQLYTYHQKELKGFALGFAGGINMSKTNYDEVGKYLASLGWPYDIDMQYNASHHVFNDAIEYLHGLNHIATPPVKVIHEAWDRFFKDNPNGNYLQICHSQGGPNISNALLSYDETRRKQISVLAIAPGAYIYSETCKEVHHFRVPIYRDIVPYLDIFGMIRSWDTTTTLKCHKDAGIMDHTFLSPTYEAPIRDRIKLFKKDNGI